jgi:hypothetical protein
MAATKDNLSDPTGLDEETTEEKAPAVDADLVESEHILLDYLSLFKKNSLVTAGH